MEEKGPRRTQSHPLRPLPHYRFAVFGERRNNRMTPFSVPNGENYHFLHHLGCVRSNRREACTEVYADTINARPVGGDCQSIRQEVAIPQLLGCCGYQTHRHMATEAMRFLLFQLQVLSLHSTDGHACSKLRGLIRRRGNEWPHFRWWCLGKIGIPQANWTRKPWSATKQAPSFWSKASAVPQRNLKIEGRVYNCRWISIILRNSRNEAIDLDELTGLPLQISDSW